MDRFVTRAPTWKTKNYSSSAAMSAAFGSSKLTKARSKELVSKSQPHATSGVFKPLQEGCNSARRLSIRDERLLKIFASQPDQPLVEIHTSDSGCSSSSDGFSAIGVGGALSQRHQGLFNTENTPPSVSGKNIISLHGPTDSHQPPSVTQQKNEVLIHNNVEVEEEERCKTPTNAMLSTSSSETELLRTPTAPPPPIENRLIMRIQRDLNSPSASLRFRAIKAMQSPTKSAYAQFDVSHTEQSIITAEERRPPEPPKSIQELMRDIIVYVEVRSGEDNRSAGVKKVISALGAKVNDKLLRDTTHVIFKDGLLSTYKKAKHWNIPVVSILWIEACKTQKRICDANAYPISNIDRYENPELYEKMKRHKSMQPDSEVNKRVRVKANTATPKNSTPRAGVLKKTLTMNVETPTTPLSNKKTDITGFFKKLSSTDKSPRNLGRILFDQPTTSAKLDSEVVAESPATKLLNNMNSDCCAERQQEKHDLPENPDNGGKTLLNNEVSNDQTTEQMRNVSSGRRSTTRTESSEATINGIEDMSLEQTLVPGSVRVDTPLRQTRRRSSVRASCHINAIKEKGAPNSATKNQPIDAITEENTPTKTVTTRNTKKRKTTYTPKPLDISGVDNLETNAITTDTIDKKRRSVRSKRQTLVPFDKTFSQDTVRDVSLNSTPKRLVDTQLNTHVEMSVSTPFVSALSSLMQVPQNDSVMRTPPQQTGSLFEQHAATTVFSSTRMPGRRRTLYDVSMDVITQRLQNINESARRTMARPKDYEFSPLPTPTQNNCTPIFTRQNPNVDESSQSTQQPPTAAADGCSNGTTDSAAESTKAECAPKKKRKLFDPNEYLLTPPNTSSSLTSIGSKTAPSARRRRTLMPLPQTELESQTTAEPASVPVPVTVSNKHSTSSRSRRSTMDFEDVKKSRTNLSTLRKLKEAAKETNAAAVPENKSEIKEPPMEDRAVVDSASSSSIRPVEKQKPVPVPVTVSNKPSTSSRSRRSTMDFEDVKKSRTNLSTLRKLKEAAKETNAAAVPENKSEVEEPPMEDGAVVDSASSSSIRPVEKQKPTGTFLVYTNLHSEQIETINEALKKLGHFQLEDNVSGETTHVVSLEPRRTMNMLRALLRGLWILDLSWVTDSLQAGKWLNEEAYEMREFSRSVEICRSERQAFGKSYNCELFTLLGPFYVPNRSGTLPKDQLVELIRLSGGKVVDQRKRAKYIVGSVNKSLDDKIYVKPNWIVDSITQMQLQPFCKYSTGIMPGLTGSQPLQTKIQGNWQPYTQI